MSHDSAPARSVLMHGLWPLAIFGIAAMVWPGTSAIAQDAGWAATVSVPTTWPIDTKGLRAKAAQAAADADRTRHDTTGSLPDDWDSEPDFPPPPPKARPPRIAAATPTDRAPAPIPAGVIQSVQTPPLDAAARQPAPAPAAAKEPKPQAPLPATAGAAQQYCVNIADAARDARYSWQQKSLSEIEQQIAKRIAMLEEKTAEYQKWLAKRDEFARKAEENLVRIYARMRPDAAGAQLVAMDDMTAAAVLSKLDPRASSAILNEMKPEEAARLTATLAGAANTKNAKRAKAAKADAPATAALNAAAPATAAPATPPAAQPATAGKAAPGNAPTPPAAANGQQP